MRSSIKDAKRVSVVLSFEQIEYMKRLLRQMAIEEGSNITMSEGIRRAVELMYPMPGTIDMFGEKVRRRNNDLEN
jgi:hypothetical protein